MRTAFAATAAAFTLLSGPAAAAVIVDTGFMPPFTVGLLVSDGQYVAARFGLTQRTRVTGVEGYLAEGAPDETLTFAIREDLGLPGAELFSTVAVAPDAEGWQGPHGLAWDLAAGAYWLAFEVRDRQTFVGALGLTAGGLPMATGLPPIAPWSRVEFDAAAVRVFGEAIPEPATWALMIMGFGAVGVALRRARTAWA